MNTHCYTCSCLLSIYQRIRNKLPSIIAFFHYVDNISFFKFDFIIILRLIVVKGSITTNIINHVEKVLSFCAIVYLYECVILYCIAVSVHMCVSQCKMMKKRIMTYATGSFLDSV